MAEQVLKIERESGEVVIFKLPPGVYQVDAYWQPGHRRKTLVETSDIGVANKVFCTALRNL
jgi:hypothetical protein